MSTTSLSESFTQDLAPPSNKNQLIKNKFLLLLELSWATLLILQDILVTLYRVVFPTVKSLKGQVVLVTGAGRGLGRGLALGFSREGCKVAVADINIDNALSTAKEICAAGGKSKAYLCNVASVDDVQALRQAVTSDLGPVDILVNNAGLIYGGNLLENCLIRDIQSVLEVNLFSHFCMIKEFLPSMKSRNSGHIVAIASIGSHISGDTGCAYIASKFGVRGLMECVRYELESRLNNKIYTTTVYPYFINTSADYVDRWDIRFPPLSIDAVVDATIAGVKRNRISLTVPSYLQILVNIGRLLPQCSLERYVKLIFLQMVPKKK